MLLVEPSGFSLCILLLLTQITDPHLFLAKLSCFSPQVWISRIAIFGPLHKLVFGGILIGAPIVPRLSCSLFNPSLLVRAAQNATSKLTSMANGQE